MISKNFMILYLLVSQISHVRCKPVEKRAPNNNNNNHQSTAETVLDHVLLAVALLTLCFPSTARVSLENGQVQTMSQLQLGDRVQTVMPDGTLTYSEIKAFSDKQHTTTSTYKSIETIGNKSIHLSGKHYIYVRRSLTDKFKPIFADDVSINDEILVHGQNKVIPEKVINVTNLEMQGAFSSHTVEGNIMVDGVLASCYAHSPDHDLAHFVMAPLIWFPEILRCIFGEDIESPVYVKIAADVGNGVWPESATVFG